MAPHDRLAGQPRAPLPARTRREPVPPAGHRSVSAHWGTRGAPAVSLAADPVTVHDFGGFPQALFDLVYPAPGDPDSAEQAARLFEAAGIRVQRVADRGLDHGAWVPLRLMYPQADVAVLQISLMHGAGPAAHHQFGRASSRTIQAKGTCCRCLWQWAPLARVRRRNSCTAASNTGCSPWTPMHFTET